MTTTPAMPEQVWLMYAKKKPGLRRLSFTNDLSSQEKASGWVSTPYALATLQAQPAAEVSDAAILECITKHEVYQYHPGALLEFARAILALRPQAVPMTEDAQRQWRFIRDRLNTISMYQDSVGKFVEWFEAHHGITAPAGGEG